MAQPELSVVTTLYRSAPFLAEFLARATAAAEAASASHEIVVVDDGSPDDALDIAIRAAQADPRIRVIELARNFGHHAAILAGLTHARGERVFLVDSDLEEPPELLLRFAAALEAEDADVVYGYHDQKVGSRMRQFASGLFWRLFNLLSETHTRENICHVRLMRRAYVDALLSLPERNIFLGGLYSWPGFRQVPMRVERVINRPVSTYNLRRRIALAVRSVVAFSARPLHLVFMLGAGIAGISLLVALATLALRLVWGSEMLVGFASIMISIWFLGGLTIMSLGVIGLYIAQLYTEAKGRPRWLVRRIHGGQGPR
ncbi:MAG: glycosyltransferase family 2 protein [Roseococcus sp.]|nr:glycosyltransferase family 2 protein [Roseococcus sp.]